MKEKTTILQLRTRMRTCPLTLTLQR